MRGERLNIGVIVFDEHGSDVRLSRRLDRVRVMSAALDPEAVSILANELANLDASNLRDGMETVSDRLNALSGIGPLALSELGTFAADKSGGYEERVQQILRHYVEPEPALSKVVKKKSKLFSEVKNAFKSQRVLAAKDEGLDSHRILVSHEINEGLFADLILKNGVYHVVQTVDFQSSERALRRSISSIAVSALVLESARMRFGPETKSRIVYQAPSVIEQLARPSLDAAQHQGAELINWASIEDKRKFINTMSALATPQEIDSLVAVSQQDRLFH